jgi:predicted SprT family Zn-dependent metalloprotease
MVHPMADTITIDPTSRTYGNLNAAYRFFNERLFGGALPPCLITLQRKARARGYFSSERFSALDHVTDEIALNPATFADRTAKEILSTLVHEMVHLRQYHFGRQPRRAYHDKQWAGMMREVGLQPSDTGEPGGRETGQHMTHYILEDGPFDRACDELLASGFNAIYADRHRESKAATKSVSSKTPFVCPSCRAKAWGKPTLHLVCGDCGEAMVAKSLEPA